MLLLEFQLNVCDMIQTAWCGHAGIVLKNVNSLGQSTPECAQTWT